MLSIPRSITTSLVFGAVFGAVTACLGSSDQPLAAAAQTILVSGWAWAMVAYCFGLLQPRRKAALTQATGSLLAAVICYYLVQLWQGQFMIADLRGEPDSLTVHWYSFWSATAAWSAIACVVGPALGWAGHRARRPGIRSLPFRVVIPCVAFIETSMRLAAEAPLRPYAVGAIWTGVRYLSVALLLALTGQAILHSWSEAKKVQDAL